MRDKIVFFILGAVLATIAYLVGDLETLTAENKITELDTLQVNDLFVKNSIVVGEVGRKSVVILAHPKYAEISLYGATATSEIPGLGHPMPNNSPILRLTADDDSAFIGAKSHYRRSPIHSTRGKIAETRLGVRSFDGKTYTSALHISDLNGYKFIRTDRTD